MNRKIGSFVLKALVAAIFLGAGSAAYAKQPKISILHCGLDEETGIVRFKEISVSNSSKGHGKHEMMESEGTGELDPTTGEEIFVEYVRTLDDCMLGEGESASMGLAACGDVVEGDVCGGLVEVAE